MSERAPRHHVMVDFQQHQQRMWAVLEEDHEKVEKENARLRAEVEALRRDAGRYRFVRELAWYVDQASYIYDIGNTRSPWPGERAPVDADDVEAAIDDVIAQQ